MTISAIAADAGIAQQVRRASYPPITTGIPAETPAPVADKTLQVEIPAPNDGGVKPFRSAKGDYRTDAAAPPTAAQASDSFTFADFIDVINPLQHIPGVNLVYQHLTGDAIKPAENVAGGFLYGGALGGIAAIAMSAIDELWKGSDGIDAGGGTALAQNSSGKFGGAAAPGAVA